MRFASNSLIGALSRFIYKQANAVGCCWGLLPLGLEP